MMEKVVFGYSLKNISIPGKQEYVLRLTHRVSHFINRLRWRAFFFLNPDEGGEDKETFGFKSLRPAPSIDGLKEFEGKLIDLIQNVETKRVKNDVQDTLKKDAEKVRKDEKLYIGADKTTNFYKMDKDSYSELLKKNVTNDYKKAHSDTVDMTNQKQIEIVTKLDLDDRVFATQKKDAYVTIKDHKENYLNDTKCRLLNPTKPELGKISKQKLAKIVAEVKRKSEVNQWRNTDSVISWFKQLRNKERLNFISFDIVNFYPSITEDLLRRAIAWAGSLTTITEEDTEIIFACKESVLYSNSSPWVKREGEEFDITMGSYDGAESTDLVGLFLLHQLKHLPVNCGLYRDDGLAVSSLTNRLTEKLWQQIKQIYEDNGLKVTAEVNKKVVHFLDITLDLNTGRYKPYMKPNTTLLYISSLSNHPPNIIKNIPLEVNRRLLRLSSTKEDFLEAVPPYQDALDKAGHKHKLVWEEPEPAAPPSTRRSRSRRVTWFNPPFSQSISTNIGAKFLQLIDSCFPPNHELRRVVNRNTVKVSYSTMPNMAQQIKQHNNKVLDSGQVEKSGGCNGHRGGKQCPVPGDCMAKGVIYGAEVTDLTTGTKETYTGLTDGTVRDRIARHEGNFRHRHQPGTRLSDYVWKLKDKGSPFNVTWQILSRASSFNPSSGMCRLCLKEKWWIMFKPATASLNMRNEIYASCRHRASKLLTKS